MQSELCVCVYVVHKVTSHSKIHVMSWGNGRMTMLKCIRERCLLPLVQFIFSKGETNALHCKSDDFVAYIKRLFYFALSLAVYHRSIFHLVIENIEIMSELYHAFDIECG